MPGFGRVAIQLEPKKNCDLDGRSPDCNSIGGLGSKGRESKLEAHPQQDEEGKLEVFAQPKSEFSSWKPIPNSEVESRTRAIRNKSVVHARQHWRAREPHFCML